MGRHGNQEYEEVRFASAHGEGIPGFYGMNVPSSDGRILIFHKEGQHQRAVDRYIPHAGTPVPVLFRGTAAALFLICRVACQQFRVFLHIRPGRGRFFGGPPV